MPSHNRNQKYGNIGYHLPPMQATDYAARAINILMDIQHSTPRMLPVFLAANSVLTLSGVRAYDAYHEFYGFYSDQEQNQTAEILLRHGVYILPSGHESSVNGGGLIFEMLNQGGLESLAGNYSMPGQEPWPIVKSTAYTAEGFAAWSMVVENWLTALIHDGTLPAGWSEDPLVAHDLRFGMLLGYPAKALESGIWLMLTESENSGELPESEQTVLSRIQHHDAYFAAWPTYQFAAELRHDPQIRAHEQLWSEVLDIVYESEWHHQLQGDTAFKTALDQIAQVEWSQ